MTRADLDAFGKTVYAYVTVDGRRIYFSSLSESQSCRISASLYDDEGRIIDGAVALRRSKFMAATLVNANGVRLYDDTEWNIIAKLNSKLTNQIWDGLSKHLGMKEADEEEQEAKN